MAKGDYRLEAELGRGATGTVYRATRTDGTVVAFKELSPVLLDDPAYIERFDREAEAMALVADPHCVALYEHGCDLDGPWIAMEYVHGCTLRAILASHGQLTASQACGVLRGALMGLGRAHRAGVVHRDVKPDNILVDSAGTSKLGDFGLTALRSGLDRWQPLEGTPAYMSPEQVRGDAPDGRSDLYAAAVVLYELLTGRPPFAGDDQFEVLRAQVTVEIPAPPDQPEAITRLLLRALAKDRQLRPQTAEEFRAGLEAAAERDLGPAWLAAAGIGGLVAGVAGGSMIAAGSGGVRRAARMWSRLGAHAGLKVAAGVAAAAVAGSAAGVAATASPPPKPPAAAAGSCAPPDRSATPVLDDAIVSQAAGEPMSASAAPSSSALAGTAVERCSWTGRQPSPPGPFTSARFQIAVTVSASTPDGATGVYNEQLATWGPAAQQVSGVGQQAFYQSQDQTSCLYVLSGNRFVEACAGQSQVNELPIVEAVARSALSRL